MTKKHLQSADEDVLLRAIRSSELSTIAHGKSPQRFSEVEGIDVYQLIDDRFPDEEDFSMMRASIELWYDPMSDEQFRFLMFKIQRKGWTRRRLIEAIDHFTDRRYPSWTPGDLLDFDGPRVYGYAWYLEHCRTREREIGAYRVPGLKAVFGWKDEIGDILQPWTSSREVPSHESQAVYRLEGETKSAVDLLKENLELRDEVRQLKEEIEYLSKKKGGKDGSREGAV